MECELTQFGFRWGVTEVTRLAELPEDRGIAMSVTTPRRKIEVYVTKTGLVRVFSPGGQEWKPR